MSSEATNALAQELVTFQKHCAKSTQFGSEAGQSCPTTRQHMAATNSQIYQQAVHARLDKNLLSSRMWPISHMLTIPALISHSTQKSPKSLHHVVMDPAFAKYITEKPL